MGLLLVMGYMNVRAGGIVFQLGSMGEGVVDEVKNVLVGERVNEVRPLTSSLDESLASQETQAL
jgi:hypothetical protein